MNDKFSEFDPVPDLETFARQVWLPAVKANKYSWRVDERISRQHILPFFGPRKLNSVTQADILDWLDGFASRKFALSTRNRIIYVLKDIFKLAEDLGLIEPGRSPMRGALCSPESRRALAALDRERADALLARLRASDRPEARAIALMILTGAAKNEILSARWENYFPEKRLLLAESSTGKKRRVWLTERATELLECARAASDSPWIFPGRDKSKPVSQIFPFWDQIRRECGLEGVRLQDLRRAGIDGSTAPNRGGGGSGPVAIVGMGMRFPGGVDNAARMWAILNGGVSAISRIPDERWPVVELTHPVRSEPGRGVAFAAGVLDNIDQFDPGFFGISPREASWMDPQQRLLLEMAWEALEDAGMTRERAAGANCGVYVGVSGMDYGQRALDDLASMTSHTMTGNTLSIVANRVSYFYDLRGPSLAIDTACSSALAAVHQACQAIRSGEVDMALAGGVNLLMHPYSFIGFSHASMLSASGRCRPFDAGGDGYVRGEGGALFLLKPLERARRDGDVVHAVILGSGVNSDGARKTGLTIPSADAQTELMRETARKSGVAPEEIDFVEAHGTGTPVGDPIEAKSIGAAYGKKREAPLPISSAKANFGHLEPASGMAGLVRAILTMKNRRIPPTPIDFAPNPAIDFAGLNIFCAASGHNLPEGKSLKGAVNSFGFGGLNAHIILGAGEKPAPRPEKNPAFPPLFISAATDAALRELAAAHSRRLAELADEDYYDYAWSCAFRRSTMVKSLAVWSGDRASCAAELAAYAAGEPAKATVTEQTENRGGGVAFVFSGNGAQWVGMGKALIEESPEFAAIIDALDEKARPILGYGVREKLTRGDAAELADTSVSQPLLFATQAAIVSLLKSMGVSPDAVMGHSVGEVAAAWASGALTMEQAIRVIHARSQSQKKARGLGGMAAVGLSGRDARRLIDELDLADSLEVAAANSPRNATISGEVDALERFGEELKKRGSFFRRLNLDYAFHSRQMEVARPELEALLADLSPAGGEDAVFVSSVSGEVVDPAGLDMAYWRRNMREPVNFDKAMAKLADLGVKIFVEIGPHAVLQRYMRENLGKDSAARTLPTLQKGNAGFARLRDAALSIHLLSDRKNIAALFPREGTPVELPFYPWQRQRCWYPRTSESRIPQKRTRPLLGWPLSDLGTAWENVLDPRRETWLNDHRVGEATVFPAAAFIELALEAAREWLGQERAALENLDILAPLIFEENRAQTLRCLLNPADGRLRILSRPRLGEGEWLEHARCRIVSLGGAEPEPEPIDDAPRSVMSGADLYARAASLGLDYGPTFRRAISVGHCETAVEAELEPVAGDVYLLDPGALDACFHSIVALRDDLGSAYLPVGAGKIERRAGGVATKIRAFPRGFSGRSLRADFEIYAGDKLLARALDCRFRAMPAPGEGDAIGRWQATARLAAGRSTVAADFGDPEDILKSLPAASASLAAGTRLWYREILPRLEAAALAGMASLLRDGGEGDGSPYFVWMANLLRREGIRDETGAPCDDLPDWEDLWLETWRIAPQLLPALLPMARVLEKLPQVLRGEKTRAETLELVRGETVADEKIWIGPEAAAMEQTIVDIIASGAARNSAGRIDILELGSPSLAEKISVALPADAYSLTRVDDSRPPRGLIEQFETEFVDFAQTEANPVEWLAAKPAPDQKRFDVVVLRDILHKSDNLPGAIKNISRLLKPGGLAIVAENYADWRGDLLNGLDDAWWRINAEGRPISSRMPPEAWRDLFRQMGFERNATWADEAADGLRAGAFLILARASAEEEKNAPAPAASWTILGDDAEFLNTLAEEARSLGQSATVAALSDVASGEKVVVAARGTAENLAAIAALAEKLARAGKGELVILTRGAGLTDDSGAALADQGALAGLARVAKNEYPGLKIRTIDLAPSFSGREAAIAAAAELLIPDGPDEIILAPTGRRAPTLTPEKARGKTGERSALAIGQPGRVDSLRWIDLPEFALADDEIEVRTMATGLNFRDVMLAMGLLPEDSLERGFAGPTLGMETAGVVARVGAGVADLRPGDRVAGFAPACFATHVRAPSRAFARIPDNLDFAAAASAPTVFITAWYALKYLARTRPGETVLIHGGAGGVGLAAIQICKALGAKILATAGTEEKRDLLRRLGVDDVFDSRGLDFADEITERHGGVDVVLNSLAGEAMRRSAALLKPFGRFLELGKRDYVENTSVGLRPFKENISYFSIDVDQLLTAKPELAAELFGDVLEKLRSGEFAPPPYRVFPARQTRDAFRAMRQARHIGKLVIDMSTPPPPERETGPAPDYSGVWLVSGGLSGFGLATARRLVKNGVRDLILASRRGSRAPGVEDIRRELEAAGARVRVESCDFTDPDAVRRLIESVGEGELTGVVHAAAVFDDKFLKDSTAADFAVSLGPKLDGALNLHEATKTLPLKYFVVYSSISAALGNPGQGNYAAANAGLEALIRARNAAGLPGCAIAWGPVGDVGYLADNGVVGKSLASALGREPMSAAAALAQLDGLIGKNGVRVVADVDWRTVSEFFPGVGRLALVKKETGAGGSASADGSLREELASLPLEEATEKIARCVVEEAGRVLEIEPSLIDKGRSLQALGLDSLMGMELALGIERRTALRLPPMLLQDGPTVGQLAERLARRSRGDENLDNEELLAELSRRHAEDMAPETAREVLASVEENGK